MIAFLAISAISVFMAILFRFLGLLFCGHLTLFKTLKICSLQEELVIWFRQHLPTVVAMATLFLLLFFTFKLVGSL